MADRGGSGTRPDSIAVGVDDRLSDVVGRVLAARRPVQLEIPTGSPLFLTAAEFRALKDGLGGATAGVTVATTDPLRRQLASVFGLQTGAPARPLSRPTSGLETVPATPGQGARVIPFPAANPTAGAPGGSASSPSSPAPIGPRRAAPASKPEAVAAGSPTKPDDKDGPSFADRTRVVRRPGDHATGSTDVPASVLAHAAGRAAGAAATVPGSRGPAQPGRTRQAGRNEDDAGGSAATAAGRVRSGSRRWWLTGGLAAAVLVASLVVAALILPRATVVLTLKTQPVATEFVIGVSASGDAPPQGVDVVVTAEPLRADVTGEWSVTTTGTRREGVEPATGTVALANPNPVAATLPAGTVLTGANGIAYATVADVEIPAANDDGRAGITAVDVAAREPGSRGNADQGELSGRLEESGIFFSNRDDALAGGTDREVPAVAAADLDRLRRQADAELPARATDALGQSGTTTVLPDSLEIEPPAYSFDLEEGTTGERVTLRAAAVATALGFRSAEAMERARAALDAVFAGQAPAGYVLDPATVAWTAPVADPDRATADRYVVTATGSARAAFPAERRDAVADELAGDSPSTAEARLRGLPETADVVVQYEPGWFPDRMPFRADRIEIVPAS